MPYRLEIETPEYARVVRLLDRLLESMRHKTPRSENLAVWDVEAFLEKEKRRQRGYGKSDMQVIIRYAQETFDYWDRGKDAKVGKRLKAMAGWLSGYDASLDALHERYPDD